MATFVWPSEDGWPYPDAEIDVADRTEVEVDDDLFCVRSGRASLFRGLDALERQVITARFGLDGARPRSLEEIQNSTGLLPSETLQAMGSGLAKLRSQLT